MTVTRVPVRVKPGTSRIGVGGVWGDDPPRLVVAVSARAVDGKANRAVIDAMAGAFGIRRSKVRIVSGDTSRSKLIEVDGPDDLPVRIEELMHR